MDGSLRRNIFEESGKSKWGLSKWALKVLVHDCSELSSFCHESPDLPFLGVLIFLGLFSNQGNSLVFQYFPSFLVFFTVVQRDEKSLVVWVVSFRSGSSLNYKRAQKATGTTRKTRHASVLSTHSDTQAVPAFHYIRMFKGIFSTRALIKRTDTLSTIA